MPKQRLRDVAEVVRSKNAGPHRLTLDIIFKEVEVLDKVIEGGSLTPEKVVEAYGVRTSDLSSWYIFRPGRALKFTFIRPINQGGLGETDIYGAQQHAPLMDLEVQI